MIQLTPEQFQIKEHILNVDGIVLVSAGAGCVDKDTEYLTPAGWKSIKDYTEGDKIAQWNPDNSIEFVQPTDYVKYPEDNLYHIKSNTVDMVVSDEHRMPYFTDKYNFKVKKFSELKNVSKLKIPRTYNKIVNSTSNSLSDELLRVLVMQSADGSHVKAANVFKICINIKKQKKKERAITNLEAADIDYTISKNSEGYFRISYYPPKVIAFKGLSSLWSCDNRQLRIVGQEATYWDGTVTKRSTISSLRFTGNKKDAELIQHAWHILTGNYVTMTKDPREYKKEALYNVQASSRKVSDLTFKSNRKRKLSTITPFKTEDGYKYCFITPSTFWLARRNGKVFPTGNTGKTFLANQVVEALKAEKVLYTAFNKAIVLEGVEKFDTSRVECKTLHALAYRYTNPNKDIRQTSYRDLPKKLSYDTKYAILKGLETFFLSASDDMDEYFTSFFKGKPEAVICIKEAINVVERMLNKELAWSFSFMLKYFHLLLIENPKLLHYDLVILDEINDTTAVALEIFKLLNAPKKLGLGEPDQAIYAFMDLVNGFEELKDCPVFPLTNSFRCSKEIASKIEKFMQSNVSDTFKFVGTDKPVKNGETLYCTMTNASIVKELSFCLEQNKSFKLLRKPSDIFACCLALVSAASGKEIYQKQYKFLEDVHDNWKEGGTGQSFLVYVLEELQDPEIRSAVQLLNYLRSKNINIFDLYKEVKNSRQGGSHTIATVFTAKGLEFETVLLSDDFDNAIEAIRQRGEPQTYEDLITYRCYYVAASRAGCTLKNARSLGF